MSPQMILTVRGTVDEVRWYQEDDGYIVFDLETEDALITVVGELGQLEPGEEVELTGKFTVHNKYGEQFHADSCVRTLPSDVVNIERYLASGVIRGIGKALAKRIVAEFGEFTLQIIENEPGKLARIKGISAEKCEEIAESAKEIFGLRSLIARFQPFGISAGIAMHCYRRWGTAAWEVISDDPFRLCLPGIDLEFRMAERVAAALGIPANSPKRLLAGFRWVLETAALEGHTCLPFAQFQEIALRALNITQSDFQTGYEAAREDEIIIPYQSAEGEYVYLDTYFHAEDFITTRIAAMLAFSPPQDFDCTAAIADEEKATGITYAEMQKKAIACAFSRGMMVLTGGPGTGKTTTLNGVIHLCTKAGSTVLLAAPTGRAAKRMTELTGMEAKTIHRMLGTARDEYGQLTFQHNEQNPLSADVIIVDEVSMVDTLLFSALLRAARLSCRIVLVGDEDQLPSVGAGHLLHTLIACGRIPTVRLTEIFRQAQESAIVRNAHKIVSGEMPDLTDKSGDFFFFDRRDAQNAAALVRSLYTERLPKAFGYVPQNDIQIIAPMRKGLVGTEDMNRMLQDAVNPAALGKPILKNLLYTFREGDKVMQIRNQYDMEWVRDGEHGTGIFNGDMGTVIEVNKNANMLRVDFDGRIVKYTGEQLDQLELSYAVTVHKSQGSEFDAVILVLQEGADRLSYRSLLYTAVTRAKKLLIVIGSPGKIALMVKNSQKTVRFSCLAEMLKNEIPAKQEAPS